MIIFYEFPVNLPIDGSPRPKPSNLGINLKSLSRAHEREHAETDSKFNKIMNRSGLILMDGHVCCFIKLQLKLNRCVARNYFCFDMSNDIDFIVLQD